MRRWPPLFLALVVLLTALLLCGCGEPKRATELLESERRLAGMYEACWKIQLKDGDRTSVIEVSTFDDMEQIEVEALLKRSNGMTKQGTWSGVRLADVLDAGGVQRPFREIRIEAWDGYIGRVDYATAILPDTIMATSQDGRSLPREDGPTRLVVASQDGFYWVRMITALEVLR